MYHILLSTFVILIIEILFLFYNFIYVLLFLTLCGFIWQIMDYLFVLFFILSNKLDNKLQVCLNIYILLNYLILSFVVIKQAGLHIYNSLSWNIGFMGTLTGLTEHLEEHKFFEIFPKMFPSKLSLIIIIKFLLELFDFIYLYIFVYLCSSIIYFDHLIVPPSIPINLGKLLEYLVSRIWLFKSLQYYLSLSKFPALSSHSFCPLSPHNLISSLSLYDNIF